MTDTARHPREVIRRTPIFSTHEHHREDAFHQSLDLDVLLRNSYVGWGPLPKSAAAKDRAGWLDRARFNSYFIWLEKALGRVYGIDRLTAANWDELSGRIRTEHASDAGHHIRILREHARYAQFLQDAYWDPGSDAGHAELATPVYRVDMWLAGFHPESKDHDGMRVHARPELSASPPKTLDDYEAALRRVIARRRPDIAALKCASAYERGIDFGVKGDRAAAAAAWGTPPDRITPAARKAFGDYVFHVALDAAAEHALPVQVHTGLACLAWSNPLLLEPTIAARRDVRFVLFHGGYPWVREIGALAHNHGNVVIDLCWLPLISTTAAVAALHEYMEIAFDAGIFTWGGDNWTSEESLGAAMALEHVLERVLSEKVDAGYLRVDDAEAFIERVMWRNAEEIYAVPMRSR